LSLAAILVGSRDQRTQFWKGAIQESFQQSLVEVLKIEISSNGQNCSILSQNVPKFELYKHIDELFNIYYGIWAEPSDSFLEENHPMTISSKFAITKNRNFFKCPKLLYFKPESAQI
jgi:hypothetical protein